jgi:Asp-tRNA(Asn)/Glu-tRNA(Gln) amidotransferase C subunit
MSLIDCLQAVKDPRRLQGQRYSSTAMLLLIIMGILRGQYGYRELGRFCEINKSYLINKFAFKNNKVPSYVSIRAFIVNTDFSSIQTAFHKWTSNYVQIEAGEWISIDGKSIRSTVSDYSNEYQNFVSLVSLFCSKREQVLHVEKLENKKSNEGQIVEELLEILDLKDAIFTLDALHCKKNSTQNCRKRQSLRSQGKRQSTKIEIGN